MSGSKGPLTALKDVFGIGKRQSSSSPEQTSSTAFKQQEHLDTSNMAKILVIGETGAGKSTFVNYITNYFRQGSLQNIKVAIPSKFRPHTTETFSHCEHDIQNTTQSKTDACNQYMFIRDSKQYLFLDTPGLSDTRGAKQDDENIVKIVDAVENLGGLTAVIIVVNGAVSRLTVNLRNVIARLRGNLPDIIMSNVILVLTNTARHAASFSVPALGLNGNVYPYYMQNSAFSQDSATWTAAALEALQYDWDQAMDEIEAIVQTIDTFKTKSVAAFKKMKDIRNEIKTQMHAARLEVSQIQKMQDEIAAFEIVVKQSNDDLVTYKDYTKEREVDKIEIVDADFHSTLCQNCNHVCHPKCKLDETTTVGAQIFQQCWAMSNGNCRQCQHKCSYTAHYHAKKTVKKSKEKLQDVLNEIKFKFDQAGKNKSDSQQKIASTTDAKKVLEKALLQKNEEIKQLCNQLRELCSGFNIAQELHALIDQLEVEAAMLKNIEAKQQANAFIRSLKEFCSMLEQDQNLSQNQQATMNIINTERPVQSQAHMAKTAPANNTPLTMQRNSNANTSFEPPSDPDSYANDDVLQAIRAIGRNKIKAEKNKKPKAAGKKPAPTNESETEEEEEEEEEGEEKDSDTATNEDSIEEKSAEEVKKHQKKTKKQPTSNLPASDMIDTNQFKSLTIQELLARYRTCTDQRMRNFIVHEMTQRSHGKSVDPIKSHETVVEFAASSQKYAALGANALNQEYQRLKSQITAITEPDILKIDQVPSILLFEIAAVHILLQRALPNDDSSRYNFSPNLPFSRPTATNLNDHSRFVSYPGNEYFNTSTHSQSKPVPNSQFRQPPYPSGSLQQSHQYPYHFDERQQASVHTNEPPPYDHQYGYPHNFPYETQQFTQQFFQNSASISPSSSSSNLPKTFANMHLSADYHNNVSSPNNHHSSSATNGGYAPMSSNSSSASFEHIGNGDNNEEFRKMNNSQLLAAYNDAYVKRNHAKSHVLYNELERRCYGDHPLLMHDKKTLFDQICTTYQGRSLIELEQLQTNIHQKICGYLTNGGAIHINNIPTEFMVEAGALTYLIAAAKSHP